MPVDEVRIGDFSQPLVSPKSEASGTPGKESSPAKARYEAVEKQLEEQADKVEAALRPQQSYEEKLKAIDVTRETAARIVDDVLFKGFYAEEVTVTPRVKCVLRTRSYRDSERIQSYLETARPVYELHYNEVVMKWTLAASLVSFGKDAFAHPDRTAKASDVEAAFQQRLSYIEGLAEPAVRLLYAKLYKFDEKIRVVLEEGAVENF